MSYPDLAPLRDLARTVLAPKVFHLLEDVPTPWLVSTHLKRGTPAVRDYILRWLANPEAGSRFATRTRWLRWLPTAFLIRTMLGLGYEGLVYPRDGAIVGHMFYQRRGARTYGFSTAVIEPFAQKGHSVAILLDYLALAARLPGVTAARLGTGRNHVTRRLLDRVRQHEDGLGWRVDADGWVTFAPRPRDVQQGRDQPASVSP